MDRRSFLLISVAGAFAAPLGAGSQPAGVVYRIGILGEQASDSSEARLWKGFREELAKRGWIEGRNILIESRWAEGNEARLPELAADLVRLRMDVIVTRGSIFVQAAKAATASIPIVFTMHADPIRTGHVASLARPGGNITGLTIVMTDLDAKGVELLVAVVPKIKKSRFSATRTSRHTHRLSKHWRRRPVSWDCRCRLSSRGRRSISKAPSRRWLGRRRRPLSCSDMRPTLVHESAWPSWP
jgi:hypothetical protein